MANADITQPKLYLKTLKVYFDQTKVYRIDSFLALLSPLSAISINVGVPFFASQALSNILNQSNGFNKNILFLTLSVITGTLFNRIGFQALMRIQAKAMGNISKLVYRRILQRGVKYHINNIGGKLVSDAGEFVSSYGNILLVSFTSGASFVLTLTIGLAVVLSQSLQLGLFVAFIITVVLALVFYDTKVRSRSRTIRNEAYRETVSHYSDSVVNATTVKLFGAEASEEKRYTKLNDYLTKVRLNDWQWAGKSGNNRMAFLLFSIIALILFLRYLNESNPSSIGVGIFAFTYTFSLIIRLFEINNITRTVEESFLKASPITEMLLEHIEVGDKINAKDIRVGQGAIDFRNITFAYSDSDKNDKIFNELNIYIKPGEKIGLVGSSGGGKTTLTRLLLRFEDIQGGTISIDEQNIAEVKQTSLRRAIGYVPQEPLLFHRTIKENIAYGKDNSTDAEIIKSAKDAQAHDFIIKLPDGYNTVVGERGVKLSGGQRQRVAIARAMIKNAPILVLDEATSALDSESEVYVQKALNDLIKGKTTIAIAHRLSTIQKMDRIIVLEDGKIVEQGSHSNLIAKRGQYAKLWAHQSGGFLTED